jgi:hypothetical protein
VSGGGAANWRAANGFPVRSRPADDERAHHDDEKGCPARSPDVEDGQYACTRRVHTEGRHVAHGTDGKALAFWVDGGQVEEVGE